jgi:hypothetical protein
LPQIRRIPDAGLVSTLAQITAEHHAIPYETFVADHDFVGLDSGPSDRNRPAGSRSAGLRVGKVWG